MSSTTPPSGQNGLKAEDGAAENTDVMLYTDPDGNTVWRTKDGDGIGFSDKCRGIVRPIKRWIDDNWDRPAPVGERPKREDFNSGADGSATKATSYELALEAYATGLEGKLANEKN